jgi:hypothetical protein
MNMNTICDIILDETCSSEELREALEAFVVLCSEITNMRPDPSFDAWAEDSLLDDGVAINPQAAAHCAMDYQRSAVFIRGVYAAIKTLKNRFPGTQLEILYAGCGPFATLLLPLLSRFSGGELKLNLLDFHQSSLDSVRLLLSQFELCPHDVQTIKADACSYKHSQKLHLVIAETMQKALEQEPQFAVTANLAPQLWPAGVFIPQRIDVTMCLADLEYEKDRFDRSQNKKRTELEKSARCHLLETVCTLLPEHAFGQLQEAHVRSSGVSLELAHTIVVIPRMADISQFEAVLLTRICVFGQYWLNDYESQITLPLKCYELPPLVGGERYRVSYQLGRYPKFHFERLHSAP